MAFDKLTLLWARYEQLDRLAAEAEKAGDEEKLAETRAVLAHCAKLVAKLQEKLDRG